MSFATKLATEILDMADELEMLRSENARLRGVEKEYFQLLNESIEHGEKMMGNLLTAMLDNKITVMPREQQA